MKKALKLVLLASLAVSLMSCELVNPASQKLAEYFEQLHTDSGFNGSVLVAKQGEVIFSQGYGIRTVGDEEGNNTDTIFNIASLSKQFTSMSIMMLAEKKLLSADDTLDKYLPELKYGSSITVKQCLTHTSGLPEFLASEELWNHTDEYHNPEELLKYFSESPLDFTPGSEWAYSNTNYIVLGIIVEKVSGMDLNSFLQKNIFSRLKMKRSFYDGEDDDIYCNRTTGFDSINPPAEAMYFHPSIAYAAGAVHSTVNDLFRWTESLKTEKLVSAETMKEIFTPGIGNYGYGWFVDSLNVSGKEYSQTWHWGSFFGYGSYITRLVDEDLTIIILQNVTAEAPEEFSPIIENVVSIVLQDDLTQTETP